MLPGVMVERAVDVSQQLRPRNSLSSHPLAQSPWHRWRRSEGGGPSSPAHWSQWFGIGSWPVWWAAPCRAAGDWALSPLRPAPWKELGGGVLDPEPRTPNALSILPAEGGGCARIWEEARGCTGMLGEARGCTGGCVGGGYRVWPWPCLCSSSCSYHPSTAASPPYGFNFDETGFY